MTTPLTDTDAISLDFDGAQYHVLVQGPGPAVLVLRDGADAHAP